MAIKVVFVTSAQPSANPRMVKSAVTLSSLGFEVTVIYARISQWASKFDSLLFQNEKKINWIGVGLSDNKSILHYYFRIRQKWWRIFNFLTYTRYIQTAKSLTLYSQELTSATLAHKADLYIGHNLGALRAVVKSAQQYSAKCIFDFEDYYSGEFDESSFDYKLIKLYEQAYIPLVDYATVSSPFIAELYQSNFPALKMSILLNVFPNKFRNKEIRRFNSGPLKLFWFSQFVGLERGLQNVLKAVSYFSKGQIQFTILGNCDSNRKEKLLALAEQLNLSISDIQFKDVLLESELFKLMETHHIGIAAEIPSLLNKDLCLSNKLFSYLLSGLALVVSNTKGQYAFMEQHPEIGFTYDYGDHKKLVQILETYLQNPDLLQSQRENALALATTTFNWEFQSASWISLIDDLVES
jgi:glycosyltransferase involved in cell wall biosynthesis